MIVPMVKAFVVTTHPQRRRLLEALEDLGVVHLVPVDPTRAVPDDETTAAIARLDRAIQVLGGIQPAPERPSVAASEAAHEVVRIQRQSAERSSRLSALYRRLGQLEVWGDVRLEQFETLKKAGVQPRFFMMPRQAVGAVKAECIETIRSLPGKRVLVAVVARSEGLEIPEGAEEIPLPDRDRPAIRAEAAEIDAALRADAARLARLAHLVPACKALRAELREKADWTVAYRSALASDRLYALMGWVPQDKAGTLAARLREVGLDAAVRLMDPGPDEQPPTLVRYPWWARPMAGLFQILGTVPGYREFDVSAAFMIALPIFSAIMISDAGYGLLYLLLGAIFYRKMAAAIGPQLGQLILIIGGLSLVWGLLTASSFGFDLCGLMGIERPLVQVDTQQANMALLMRISFWLAAIHLSCAHLWLAKKAFPHPRFLGELGWATFIWGTFGIIKMLLLKDPFLGTVYPWLLIVGGAMAVLFARPSWNLAKAVGIGVAKFPLAAIGTLSDTISYVRLMALGVAGTMLAVSFNDIAADVPWPASIPILIVGHALTVALSIVALLAHGVRLNVLEFSNNLGMQWSGYAYEPFSKQHMKEA